MADIAGDKDIHDLTPQTTNLGDRLVKNLRICGSGIYTYDISEAPLLHLDPVPEKYRGLDFINVYRPADVLVANKDKFARVPIITGHHQLVNRDNAKRLVVGMVGDTVDTERDDKDGETYLYTTGTIVAGDGVDAYEQYGQLSVGYDPDITWCEGDHNGVHYHAVLRGFRDVNHLLICKTARGGPQCMVMDSLDGRTALQQFIALHNGGVSNDNKQNGGVYMGVFQKIFRSARPTLAGDAATVSALLGTITMGADPEKVIANVRELAGDSIDAEMSGYLDELAKCKGEAPADIEKAVGIVRQKWEAMCGDSGACPKCGKEPCACAAGDADDKSAAAKPDKPEDKPEKVGGDGGAVPPQVQEPEKKDDKPSAGDAIDYEKLAGLVAAKLEEKKQTAGDSVDEPTANAALRALSMAVAGDAAQGVGSADIIKDIWG